jgi:hypothetical protein
MSGESSSGFSSSLVWQTRLSREAAASYERDLQVLGLDRSEALRRGLRLLHREALETAMARDVAAFYTDGRAPLSSVTAAAYGDPPGRSRDQGARESGQQGQPQRIDGQPEPVLGGSDIGVPSKQAPSGPEGPAEGREVGSAELGA